MNKTIMAVITFLSIMSFAFSTEAKNTQEKYYFFMGISSYNSDGSISFNAQEMSKELVIDKSRLWLEAQEEIRRLAQAYPEPDSNDPQAFMDWQNDFSEKSGKLNLILKKFYAIKGKTRLLQVSGDEISRSTIIKAEFGAVIQSSVMDKELIDFFNNGKDRVYHCNFIRLFLATANN